MGHHLGETRCPGGTITLHQEMIITALRTATLVGIIIPEIQGTMGPLPENTPIVNIPVPEMTMAQCPGDIVTVMAMGEVENQGVTVTEVVAPTEIHMMVTVTLAAPRPHVAPHHPMVGAVEAVVTMTMAAVPGMDMAVVKVTPAVGMIHTHLAVVTVWADRIGAQPPLLTEAIVIHTAAQVVEGLAVAAVAADLKEEWVATDTEMDM